MGSIGVMKRRSKMLFAVLLAAPAIATCFLIWTSHSKPEPVYKGKRMREWIAALGNNSLDTFTLEREFAAMKPDPTPYLIRALNKQRSPWDTAYAAVHPKLPTRIRNRLPAPCDAVMVRCNAINVLGYISTNVTPVIPALIAALKDREGKVRLAASGALGSVRRRAERWDTGATAHDTEAVVQLIESL